MTRGIHLEGEETEGCFTVLCGVLSVWTEYDVQYQVPNNGVIVGMYSTDSQQKMGTRRIEGEGMNDSRRNL